MYCTTPTTPTAIEITEQTKMYLIKSEVRQLLREQGYGELSTKSLKKKAIASDWVANKADFRFKSTWLMVYQALTITGKVVRLVPRTSVERVVQELLREYQGYAPIFEYRDRLPQLSRTEQDKALYRLENEGKIELSTLQEGRFYRNKIDQGIPQAIGGPIFFIQAA